MLHKLTDFDPVAGLPTLRELDIAGCRGLSTLDFVRPLTALTHLRVVDCGEIASLQPLRELAQLRAFFFYESTRVADGDVSVLLELPKLREVAFANRRHYTHREHEINAELALRAASA